MQEVELELETERELVVILERNRGWLALRSHIEGRREARERKLVNAFLGRGEPVDQRQVDYLRGYFDAMDWMLSLPRRMQTKLKEE